MTDKERVIVGLQDALEILDGFDEQDFTLDERKELHGSMMSMIQDALDYMKAQKPVEPVYNGDCDWEECPNCGYVLSKRYNPCPECGRPVKWND